MLTKTSPMVSGGYLSRGQAKTYVWKSEMLVCGLRGSRQTKLGDSLLCRGTHHKTTCTARYRDPKGAKCSVCSGEEINRTSCMKRLQTARSSFGRVAENIMTCFSCGVILTISWTSRRISRVRLLELACSVSLPASPIILSHSSRTKYLTLSSFILPERAKASILPGVPTTIWGQSLARRSSSFLIGIPPKKTATLIPGRYLLKRSYSLEIWKASSRVWHMHTTDTCNFTRNYPKQPFIKYLAVNRLKLLQCCDDEYSCFTHTGLGLADDIHAEDGLRNTLMLDWKQGIRILETRITNLPMDARIRSLQ